MDSGRWDGFVLFIMFTYVNEFLFWILEKYFQFLTLVISINKIKYVHHHACEIIYLFYSFLFNLCQNKLKSGTIAFNQNGGSIPRPRVLEELSE